MELYGTPERFEFKPAETLEAESLLLGRTTYESFVSAWPEREGEFADKMNTMPEHVVTSTRTDLGWNATPLTGDLPAAVEGLKRADGGPIMVAGSASLARALLVHRLVDELRLQVFPISIGGGLRVFPAEHTKIPLALVDLIRLDSGVMLQTYRPVGTG